MKKNVLAAFLVALLSTGILAIFTERNYGSREEDLVIAPSILIDTVEESAPSALLDSSGEWVQFVPGALPGTRSKILPKSRDTMGLCVDSTFFGLYNDTRIIENHRYNVINVPSAGHAEEIGKPAVPIVTRYLEVPHDVNITLTVIHEESRTLDDYYIVPAQEATEDNPYSPIPPFTLDNATYIANAFFPSDIAELEGETTEDAIILRGRRIVALTLYPVQFNPVKRQLKAFSKIEVRLGYTSPAQLDAIPTRLVSPAFEELCQGLILDYPYSPSTRLAQTFLASSTYQSIFDLESAQDYGPAEYLIIVNNTFYDQILPLADWKRQKGLLTEVVKTSEITATGSTNTPTASDIAGFIQDAYDTWSPAPSYVLLVGDSNHIHPHYVINHYSTAHSQHPIPTDLYYGTVDGTDMFPDIFVGRLSVDTTDQAATIVQKILDYEKTPPDPALHPEFYSHVGACAFFQDNDNNGRADREYVETSEEIIRQNTYFGLGAIGYTVDRIYETNSANPIRWDDGANIPNDLTMANFPWDGDRTTITSNITDGRFLIYHRDHGESRNLWNHDVNAWGAIDGWNHPEYDTTDINGLANGELLPFVLSIECECGWYDGEVDNETWGGQDAFLNRNFESFCEEFVRYNGGGAIAAIGASRNSPSTRNNQFLKGLIDAIWPEFDSDFSSGGLFSFGQVLVYGKVYMANLYHPTTELTKVMFSLYNLFGDPETPLWTSPPSGLAVVHPASIGSLGLQRFVVTVNDDASGEPVNNAKVCLRRGSDIFEIAYTDALGDAYFDLTPSSSEDIDITVTRHNYYPYEGVIAVTDNGATLSVNVGVGPSGMTVTVDGTNYLAGELVSIDFGGMVMPTMPLGASFSEDFQVPVNGVGAFNIIGTGQTSGRIGLTVFRRIQQGVDLYIYSQWDDSTWNRNPDGAGSEVNPVWNNPCIQLYDRSTGAAVASDNLIVGTTYRIEATIYNRASTIAADTAVSFEWAFIGVGQKVWYEIGTDTVTVPAAWGVVNWVDGVVIARVEWTPSVTGHTCIVAEISHPWDLDLDDNKGQENTNVLPISSPGSMNFTVVNPSDTTALVYLEARQKGSTDEVWAAVLERVYPQELAPGENQTVTLLVETPEDAPENETRTFVIQAYINDELIGGLEITAVKHLPTPPPPWPTIVIVVVVVILLVVVVFWRLRLVKARR